MQSLFIYIRILYLFFFFFSSRRRHTRSLRDWSSDVCSSDLVTSRRRADGSTPRRWEEWVKESGTTHDGPRNQGNREQIGRASCRERGENLGGGGIIKKKKIKKDSRKSRENS